MTDYSHITTACGVDHTVAEGASEWILDRHAHAHNKGTGGLSAGGCETAIGAVPEPEQWAEPEPGA
jgi:hypothetical protein